MSESSKPSPARIKDASLTALLLIDLQKGFDHPTHWGTSRSTPALEQNIQSLLAAFRAHPLNPLIIHIRHLSIQPESMLHPSAGGGRNVEFYDYAQPLSKSGSGSEPVFSKNVNSAFIGTALEETLRNRGIRTLVIAGLTTDHCVSTSTRMANNLRVVDIVEEDKESGQVKIVDPGRIILVGDGCATFNKGGWDAEQIHAVHLASLNEEFAEVLSTQQVLAALS